MTLNPSIPTGSTFGSDLPAIIRETREAVNNLEAAVATIGAIASYQDVTISEGETSFEALEGLLTITYLGASVAVDLESISNGRAGELMLIRAANGNVTIKHNANKIKLNGGIDYNLSLDDWIILANFGGVPETETDGVWIEVARTAWIS
jgi:hypothetical protein